MEPTIYKPSIYNGAGIYKTEDEGGGGGDGPKIYEFDVLGKTYKYIKLDEGLFWPLENLDYIDENIQLGLTGYYNTSCAAYYNNDEANYKYNGLIYSRAADVYIDSIKPNNTRYINSSDLDKLFNLVAKTFKYDSPSPDYGYISGLSRTNSRSNSLWKQNQNIAMFGIEPTGYYNGSSNSFTGITTDAFFGISDSTYDNVLSCRYNQTLAFSNGGRYTYAYATRLLIDLN